MTLFDAIRELKEGQEIRAMPFEDEIATWSWGKGQPNNMWSDEVVIVDLPKPKMSLKEGLYQAAEAIPYELLENPSPLQFTKHFIDVLRSLPIDWQAEADRKEGE